MKQIVSVAIVAILIVVGAATIVSAGETTLFDSGGRPTSYVAEDLTIYTWSGKPVAYLYPDTGNEGFHIYGFNGKHLGWFVQGIARDHNGNGACGIKAALGLTALEPLKSLKELKPLKSLRELPPLRPLFSTNWSVTPLNHPGFVGERLV
jgi:hypothetical protein